MLRIYRLAGAANATERQVRAGWSGCDACGKLVDHAERLVGQLLQLLSPAPIGQTLHERKLMIIAALRRIGCAGYRRRIDIDQLCDDIFGLWHSFPPGIEQTRRTLRIR